MAKKRGPQQTPEAFIKAVMKHADGRLADIASELGVSQQAVSKRLREYRKRGVKGLPEFDGRAIDTADVQQLVNKYRGK
jgi:predicted transcriptional regulator